MKKTITLLITLFVTSILCMTGAKAAFSDESIISARENGQTITEGGSSTDIISSEYSFALGSPNATKYEVKNNNTENLEAVKSAWNYSGNFNFPEATSSLATNDIKGKFSILYKGVNFYKNNLIDVKATVMDFQSVENPESTPLIKLTNTEIGNTTMGIKWITIKYEFFISGTTTPIEVKGNTTYWDVDAHQGIIIHDGNNGIHATSNCTLNTSTVGNYKYVYDATGGTVDGNSDLTEKQKHSFTEKFSGTSITRTYTYGNPLDSSGQWQVEKLPIGITHSASPVVDTDIPRPIKEVSQTKVAMGEEFEYNIIQTVPMKLPAYTYPLFKIEDTLEECLNVDAENVTVADETGEDVTDKFNITNEGQKLIITLKETENTVESFYGHTYVITINTSIKSDFNMSKYKNNGKYIIPNKAYMYIKNDNYKDCSDIVNIEYDPEKISDVPSTAAALPLYASLAGIILLLASLTVVIYINKKKKA